MRGAVNNTTASCDEVMESRAAAAARPSSFIQQLQSHVVDFDYNCSNVDDHAPDRQQTVSASSSSSSSPSLNPQPVSFEVDDERRAAASSTGVNVARSDDVTPMPPTSSLPVADLCRLPLLPSETQHDPTAVVVVSPLASLFNGDEGTAGTKSAATLQTRDGDDDYAACRRPLSSGWATALAAASIAGKAAAASTTKRRPNAAKSGGASFNIRASRSLFCLTVSNPIRKLSISVVEWKYPLHSSSLSALFTATFYAIP